MIGTYKHNELLVPRQNNQNSIFNWSNLATAVVQFLEHYDSE
jgi:hypothetical protein